MMKMLKDSLVATLVVGSFLVGAVTLAQEVSRPWPLPTTVSERLEQQNAAADEDKPCSELAATTYVITESRN